MQPSQYINLDKARALIVDDNPQSQDIIVGVLTSFGLRNVVRKAGGLEAQDELKYQSFDLVLANGALPDLDGYDLTRWLRREADEANRMTPVILLTSHTRRSLVEKARDCGANFIVTKPVSPAVMLERILWVAKGDRLFIECEAYVGPDRRWRNLGPPVEFPDGRRRDDQSIELGEAGGQNMSQDELDALIKPMRSIA
ncbi:response regulator [Caulobacter sp. UNC279MFTsu5.1]|uniref:response regulator n=1 Tax=Caulobacter sp. UNC279MFTsu5.1 TaxID=1502775 RepID=UPI0008E66027|nr:response regulator [Caulobacter sp. UNC279MFTsu5.1]SFI72566.1 CheY chemotaxis protein or a CheY-like REC (receiver) domain [Caulobacter sp. UNC279MFTsu5.1]